MNAIRTERMGRGGLEYGFVIHGVLGPVEAATGFISPASRDDAMATHMRRLQGLPPRAPDRSKLEPATYAWLLRWQARNFPTQSLAA